MNPFALGPSSLSEPWRLWTCHFVHWDAGHALWSTAAFFLPFPLLEESARRRLAATVVVLAPLLSLSLLPWLQGGAYGGLSGLASAAWAFAGLELLVGGQHRALGRGLLVLLVAKLVLELGTGTPLLAAANAWHDLPAAHLNGALLGGLAWGAGTWIRAVRS